MEINKADLLLVHNFRDGSSRRWIVISKVPLDWDQRKAIQEANGYPVQGYSFSSDYGESYTLAGARPYPKGTQLPYEGMEDIRKIQGLYLTTWSCSDSCE